MKKTLNIIISLYILVYSILILIFPSIRELFIGKILLINMMTLLFVLRSSQYNLKVKNKNLIFSIEGLLLLLVGVLVISSFYVTDGTAYSDLLFNLSTGSSAVSILFFAYMSFFVAHKRKLLSD